MSQPTAGQGPAARAVLADYHHRVTAYRRRLLLVRSLVALLVLWTLAGAFVAPAIAVSAGQSPSWLGAGSPAVVLVLWFVFRDRLADAVGVRGEPAFPAERLELAAQRDAEAAAPRAFGAVPDSIRVYHPEHW